MAMVMRLCGIVLAAIGLALGVMSLASSGQMQVYGLTPETAAILLVGGILSLGVGALIDQANSTQVRIGNDAIASRVAAGQRDTIRDLDFGKSAAAAGAVVATTVVTEAVSKSAPETVSETLSGAKSSVSETIEALEQAKSDIRAALGGSESFDPPEAEKTEDAAVVEERSVGLPTLPVSIDVQEPVQKITDVPAKDAGPADAVEEAPPAETPPAETPPAETGLFVVEEQVVRGKPARLLSDGTVEAETDEGWMRFENLEHLNEYLDSLTAS